ncbi:MAG: type II secretion system protein GspG [Candidatus Methylomirabilales bacterium]
MEKCQRGAEAGFTLMEVLLLLILLALIVATAVPRFGDLTQSARITTTQNRLQDLQRAFIGNPSLVAAGQYSAPGYWGDREQLPAALNDLVTQGSQPAWNRFTRRGWNGPYVESDQLLDAWGNAICYCSAGTCTACGTAIDTASRVFTLTSGGPDGNPATTADNVSLTVNF